MSNKSPFRPFQGHPPAPPSVVIDRMGRMVEAGHLVLFHAQQDMVFEVVAVGPVLNPSVPDGQRAMQVTMRAQFTVQTLAAMRDQNLIVVGETEARAKQHAGANGAPVAEEIPQEEPSGITLTDGDRPLSDVSDDEQD